ncbi:hypothetical protein ACQKFX_29170, partial [Cupriavidus metallidurans]
PHDVREKLVRSSATPGCLIPSVMGFVEQGQGHCGLDRRNGVTAPYACESRDLGIELFSFFANSQQMMNLFAAKLHR